MQGINAPRSDGIGRGPGRRWPLVALVGAVAVALPGCRGERSDKPPRQFFPDLDDQPKYKAQSRSSFFKEYTDEKGRRFGRTMREPVKDSVPFGAKPYAPRVAGIDFSHREEYLKEDRRVYEGREPVFDADAKPVLEPDGSVREVYIEYSPVPVTAELLALGEKKFNIYCIVCHGALGDGKGLVGVRWSYPLPSWYGEQYLHGGEKGQDGYIFHTIRYGVPNVGENVPYPLKMPSYASKVSEKEAWAIVAYVRALQGRIVPIDSVPEREQMELQRRRGAAPKAEAQPAGGGKERGS